MRQLTMVNVSHVSPPASIHFPDESAANQAINTPLIRLWQLHMITKFKNTSATNKVAKDKEKHLYKYTDTYRHARIQI